MKRDNLTIRLAEEKDYRKTENIIREAFWNIYRPGCLEHFVINQIRKNKGYISALDFVLEDNGKIIGQNIFFGAVIKTDSGKDLPIMSMGPISVANEYKRQGYGKILLDYSLKKAEEYGVGAVCFEGNIDFYGKSGFTFASNFGIRYHGLPEGEDASFFLCKELKKGYLNNVTGEYATPNVYMVDEKEAEEFDKSFPKKEKLKLPGQLF